ncbi:hypothetical protein BGZ57DRAFT_983707 [Hyaloscypha finlandica]|nr:hypothetical protein BGZ57DRAFT_983707 [Hyaloscypha finlandica]
MLLSRQAAPPPQPLFSPEFLAVDHGTRMIIIKAKIKGVSSMVAFLRVYVKAVMVKTVGWNDYMIMAAMGICLFCGGSQAGSLPPYFGRLRKSYFSSEFSPHYCVVLDPSSYERGGTVPLQDICGIIPPWAGSMKGAQASCYRHAVNIFTDVLFASLPIPAILTLQLQYWALGLVSRGQPEMCIDNTDGDETMAHLASVVRVVLLANFFNEPDTFFNDTYVNWTSVETNVGILAVCLTTLRPFFAWVLDTANNLSFRTTQTRRQSTNVQLFGQTSIVSGLSIRKTN